MKVHREFDLSNANRPRVCVYWLWPPLNRTTINYPEQDVPIGFYFALAYDTPGFDPVALLEIELPARRLSNLAFRIAQLRNRIRRFAQSRKTANRKAPHGR